MSKKRSRSHSRSRSRSKERQHNSRSRSREASRERKPKRTRHDDDGNKGSHSSKMVKQEPKSSDNNFDYSNKDPTNNVSYEEKALMKISNDIIVPDYLVSLLIGKNGECIRNIMNKSGSMINFQKEYNDDFKINTSEGVLGRICNLKGKPEQNSVAMQLISEMIIKLESSLNGIRKEN